MSPREADRAVDARDLMRIAEAVALEAGELIRRRRREGVEVAGTKSTATDVVTKADHESENLVRDRIRSVRPDDGLVGEEGASASGSSGVTWVIDPIDGTVNYLYDIPAYAVSIAAELNGQVIAGAVVNPVSGETWTAWRGGGAYLNGERIWVRPTHRLAEALVVTGFGYADKRRAAQAEVLHKVIASIRDVRRSGVASVDLCWVAMGRVDACYERGLKPWDVAAGLLIAEEAGAKVGGLHGARPSEELVIAATPDVFDELHDLLAAAGANSD
jgi:myo-inositol-1(or 4)-monophosphatase